MFYNQSQAYSLFKMSFIFIFIFYGIIPLLNEIREILFMANGQMMEVI